MTVPIDPTPEEIAAACRRMQAEWSDKQRAKRRVPSEPYEVPVIAMADVLVAETRRGSVR